MTLRSKLELYQWVLALIVALSVASIINYLLWCGDVTALTQEISTLNQHLENGIMLTTE